MKDLAEALRKAPPGQEANAEASSSKFQLQLPSQGELSLLVCLVVRSSSF